MPTDDPRAALGLAGEKLAEQVLVRAGLKIVARRFATPVGELDLVARDGKTVVFVEVKTRRDRKFAEPEDAVTPAKQRRLLRAVAWFLRERNWTDRPCRFDVVTVVGLADGAPPEVRHVPAAFLPPR